MIAGHRAPSRGFTLVEMLTSLAIIGLILLLIGVEFDASLESFFHTRSNWDNESNARFITNKITNRLRTATPWIFNPNPPPAGVDQVIISPVPVGSPGATSNVLTFYRVRPGQLRNPVAIPTQGLAPNPPYDIVTIQRSTCPYAQCSPPSPNYLVETAVDAFSKAPSETPLVLGKDVTTFSVTALGSPQQAQLNVSLTITSTNSRCGLNCAYTTTTSVWVGGDQVLNQ